MKVTYFFDYDYLVYINKGDSDPEDTIDIPEELYKEYLEIITKFEDIQENIKKLIP